MSHAKFCDDNTTVRGDIDIDQKIDRNNHSTNFQPDLTLEMNGFRFCKSKSNSTISFQNPIQIQETHSFKIQTLFNFKRTENNTQKSI